MILIPAMGLWTSTLAIPAEKNHESTKKGNRPFFYKVKSKDNTWKALQEGWYKLVGRVAGDLAFCCPS